MVRLLGQVVRQLDGRVLFRVAGRLAEADRFGFADGDEFWVGCRQCVLVEATEAPIGGVPLDELRLPFELANYLSQTLHEEE